MLETYIIKKKYLRGLQTKCFVHTYKHIAQCLSFYPCQNGFRTSMILTSSMTKHCTIYIYAHNMSDSQASGFQLHYLFRVVSVDIHTVLHRSKSGHILVLYCWWLVVPVLYRRWLVAPVLYRWLLVAPILYRWLLVAPVLYRWLLVPSIVQGSSDWSPR